MQSYQGHDTWGYATEGCLKYEELTFQVLLVMKYTGYGDPQEDQKGAPTGARMGGPPFEHSGRLSPPSSFPGASLVVCDLSQGSAESHSLCPPLWVCSSCLPVAVADLQ